MGMYLMGKVSLTITLSRTTTGSRLLLWTKTTKKESRNIISCWTLFELVRSTELLERVCVYSEKTLSFKETWEELKL